MQRTISLRLQPTVEQACALAETARLFTLAFNGVTSYGWREREKNGVTLHHATYRSLKTQYPTLVSDLHIQARVKATEAVKSALALATKGRTVSAPVSPACSPRYNVHTMRLDWQTSTVRLSTTSGRQSILFVLSIYARKYAGCEEDTADLIWRDGVWWLHVVVTVPAPKIEPTDEVIGVDLGLTQPAVTSTGRFLGKKAWRNVEARRFKLRRMLQKAGTKSAKRRLKRMRRKQARFRRDCDHVLSKQIIQAAPPGGTVVLENLRHLRGRVKTRHGRQARRLHGWSFDQLRSFVEYKAEERGVTVSVVDPRATSQRCPSCGHVARNNRRSRSWFQCRACGYQAHADLVGARNVAAKYRALPSMSGEGGLPVMQPIAGVTVARQHALPASRLL
jgi:IS605 OrfB family transposase